MKKRVRVLTFECGQEAASEHWQNIWERTNRFFFRVKGLDNDHPVCDDWVKLINRAVHDDRSPVILIAHSLAAVAVAHWSARHHGPIQGALLIAPTDVDSAGSAVTASSGFSPLPKARLRFPSIVIASTNDPGLSLARAKKLSEQWGARLDIARDAGALGHNESLGDWPFGFARYEELMRDEAAWKTASMV